MAVLYLVGAWLVVQVVDTLLPMFGAPDWISRTVVLLLAIGFVPALVFAWVFELTPEGLERDADVPAHRSIAPQTAKRMNRTIVRSEEHTSELQSLMRISYAVFCLKKNKHNNRPHSTTQHLSTHTCQ